MGLIWRELCTFMKRTNLLSIKTFEIDPFTNQFVNFLVFYDKIDILGYFIPKVNLVLCFNCNIIFEFLPDT